MSNTFAKLRNWGVEEWGGRLESHGPDAGSLVQEWVWSWPGEGPCVTPRRLRAGRWCDESGSRAQHKRDAPRKPAGGFCRNQADILF